MHVNNEFSINSSEQVKSFCQPFLREFQLTSFNYGRIYPDKSLLALHTDPLFAKLYLQLNTPPIAPIPERYWQWQSFYFLPKIGNDKNYLNLLKHSTRQLNSDNPLYIVNQCPEYIEVGVFCSALGDNEVINRYFNHMSDLSFFVTNFSRDFADFNERELDNRLIMPPHLSPRLPQTSFYNKPEPYEDFYRKLVRKKVFPFSSLEKLTSREIQCLYYLCRGHSYKLIANQLGISSRTVETHLINAKVKMGIKLTSQLILDLSRVQ